MDTRCEGMRDARAEEARRRVAKQGVRRVPSRASRRGRDASRREGWRREPAGSLRWLGSAPCGGRAWPATRKAANDFKGGLSSVVRAAIACQAAGTTNFISRAWRRGSRPAERPMTPDAMPERPGLRPGAPNVSGPDCHGNGRRCPIPKHRAGTLANEFASPATRSQLGRGNRWRFISHATYANGLQRPTRRRRSGIRPNRSHRRFAPRFRSRLQFRQLRPVTLRPKVPPRGRARGASPPSHPPSPPRLTPPAHLRFSPGRPGSPPRPGGGWPASRNR